LFLELTTSLGQSSSSAADTAGQIRAKPAKAAATKSSTQVAEFITLPRPSFDIQREYDADEMDTNEVNKLEKEMQKEAKKYLKKPAKDFPEWPWIISKRALELYEKFSMEMQKRDQDRFGMHIYNDFTGYGIQEVIETIVRRSRNRYLFPKLIRN
jgi:hypothetical protein